MTRITYALLAANLAVYGLEALLGDPFVTAFALWPLGFGFRPWQILTGAFLHAGLSHLGANMFGLWMFGRQVERALGGTRFTVLYFASAVAASLTQLAVTAWAAQRDPTLGASGAIFGILAAFALLFPRRVIVLLIPPIPLPAPLFVLLYALFELYAGVSGAEAGVAHFAHLGGLAGGIAVVRHWQRTARRY